MKHALDQRDAAVAERDAVVAERDAEIARLRSVLPADAAFDAARPYCLGPAVVALVPPTAAAGSLVPVPPTSALHRHVADVARTCGGTLLPVPQAVAGFTVVGVDAIAPDADIIAGFEATMKKLTRRRQQGGDLFNPRCWRTWRSATWST